jgi:uridine phosphorylase
MENRSLNSGVDSFETVDFSSVQYSASELVENSDGRVYHLAIEAETLAKKIILVGDPARVDLVASFFDSVLHTSQHREFTSKSGFYKGKYITVMSTGIGTDNIDIVLNELDACVNIDLLKRKDVKELTSLEIVRIGTCGIVQKDVPLFSYIVSSYAYGFDNVAHFYDLPLSASTSACVSCGCVKSALDEHIADVFPMDYVKPYMTAADATLREQISSERTVSGITVTSSGFYGPQGRALRLNTKTRHLNEKLATFSQLVPSTSSRRRGETHGHEAREEVRVMNYEMETSALYALGKGMGHRCATICLGLANRAAGKFGTDDELAFHMMELLEYVLDRI